MPRQQGWSDDELRDAAAAATTMFDVCKALGLKPGGGTYNTLERHMDRLGIDRLRIHRRKRDVRRGRRPWTDEDLAAVVRESLSFSDLLRRLGYAVNGGNHRFIVGHIRRLGVDTSHFRGQQWAKGTKLPFRPRIPLQDVLVENSTYGTSTLRRRLIRSGLKPPHCEICGRDRWQGKALPLQLDHVNGNHTDNRLDNLRILCPNCHAVTDTWCARNRDRKPA